MNLTEQEYNALPESLREEIARNQRDHWGMFYDSEWDENDKDLEVIEDSVMLSIVFRWLAGRTE